MNNLIYDGVNMDSAQSDAYYWALYNTDATMEVIRSAEDVYKRQPLPDVNSCTKDLDKMTACVI